MLTVSGSGAHTCHAGRPNVGSLHANKNSCSRDRQRGYLTHTDVRICIFVCPLKDCFHEKIHQRFCPSEDQQRAAQDKAVADRIAKMDADGNVGPKASKLLKALASNKQTV